jgi:hypothetical protein
MVEPRFAWFPPRSRSLGRDACDWWKAAGGTLFDWQEFVIEGILGLGDDDRFVSTDDGIDVARQNGKGVILQVIEGFVAFELGHPAGYDVVMHTAHEFATALEHQWRLEEVIQDASHLHSRVKDRGGYKHANGQESINLKDGTRIIFKARTRGGGRGWSGDLLVWDEAMEIPEATVGAQKPTLRASTARHGAKTIYAGSAVDQTVHQHGVSFAFIREKGIAKSPRVSWVEWSAPLDHPDEMTADLLRDRSLWRQGNPSMDEGLIAEQTMADEIETMPARVAAVELFGVGDWPRTDGQVERKIDLEAWCALINTSSRLVPPYTLTFDVSPERMLAVALTGRNEDGKFHTEIHEHRAGMKWFVPWLVERWERSGHDIYTIAADGIGPAGSLRVELEEAGIPVEWITSSQLGEMCGYFVDVVAAGDLEHLGSQELRDAIAGAAERPLNDRWAWKRISSSVDISPLVAATIGVGIAAGVTVGDLAIF